MIKEVRILNDIGQLPQVNDVMAQLSILLRLSEKMCMNLKLALEEAVSNTILYAYPDEKNKEITVRFEATADWLNIVITDSGIPFDPTQKESPDLTLPVHEKPIGGLGIHLVREIMTDVKYTRNGDKNILTMSKKIR